MDGRIQIAIGLGALGLASLAGALGWPPCGTDDWGLCTLSFRLMFGILAFVALLAALFFGAWAVRDFTR